MKNNKILVYILVFALLIAAGWAGWHFYKKENENPVSGLKPRVEMGIGHISNITDSTIDLSLQLLVHNPLPVELDMKGFEYFVEMNGVKIIENEYSKPLLIKSRDSTMVMLPSQLKIKALKQEGNSEAKRGEDSADYHFEGTFALNKPFLGKDSVTLSKDKRLPLYRLPKVEIVDFDITKFRLGNSDVTLQLKFSNQNPFPVQFEDPSYVVSLGSQERLAEGSVKGATKIKGKSSEIYQIPLSVDMGKFLKAVGQVITKGKSIPFTLYFKSKLVSDNEIFKKSDVNVVVDGTLKDIETVKKNLSK
ncbi:LEA type 2 family protein [Dyadobacter sp. Leaf189]|uniref:LEA type 2 family protein n=1 Tax=Dyadobacter sp. Leaf189 TaxID=1736295 RepID=UPI0006FF1AF8|nr:LEA type 2 family protein [Dyadobacter sp. Leaf189]KQS33486.1 Water stress and hypersensitive response domain-containing protein [Dyadobacter sp. Leaf189]